MEIALLLLFSFLLFLIFLYSLSQLHLLINYFRKKNTDTCEKYDLSSPGEFPYVTIQLPLYNEREVVERLLKNIANINYPKEKLEIQVLDDSTDESAELTEEIVSQLSSKGLDIKYLRRDHRKNFKAGALREGLKVAKGEFIAVFDSDFLPQRNWLLLTLPYFKNENIGVVQTRWGHLNRNYSLLTKIQAFALDFHFILEQNGRNFSGFFINFNGTAGVWRKKCIQDSGNWEGDTLTEDLDLSYRAQLKDWKFKYLGEVETPAELPVTIDAVRSQQFRWNKGAAENFQKNFKKVLNDKRLSATTKIHCFFHLLNSSLFLLVLLLAILSLPILFLTERPEYSFYFKLMLIFGISTIIFFFSYWVTYSRLHGSNLKRFFSFLWMFFTFFSVAMGFSLHNSRAVLEGHFGKRSDFVRTPKFNIMENVPQTQVENHSTGIDLPSFTKKVESSPVQKILSGKFRFQLFLEILLMLYFAFAIGAAFWLGNYSLLLFHLMLFLGFAFVVFRSVQAFIPKRAIGILNLKNKAP